MLNTTRFPFILAIGLIGIGFATTANASALYFERVIAQTQSEATCFRFAGDVARTLHFRNVHANRLEVAGESNGAYVAITCIGRGQANAMAVVMSVSDNFAVAKQAGTEAANRLKKIICFDSPC